MIAPLAASLFARANEVIPGGVNSPVRAFGSVGGAPRFIARAQGPRIWDEDGHSYLDYVCGWGPLLFGHAPRFVIDAIRDTVPNGTLFGTPTRLEVEYAETFLAMIRWADQVRLTNSGTEAASVAIRLARAVTGRPAVLRFDGGYHGHIDAGLAPSDDAGRARADLAAGIPAGVAGDVRIAAFNDLDSVESLLADDVAAVIVEPIATNTGVIAPGAGFLADLRHLCDRAGALLVFDEVVTGFRVARGGAAEHFGVRPDLAIYGKVIGGGLPVGAIAGPRALMSRLAPAGRVFHAGTFAGNPLTVAAGLAQLRAIAADPHLYDRLEHLGAALEHGIARAIARGPYPVTLARAGSLWTLFFTPDPIVNARAAARTDRQRFAPFFHAMLRHGVHLAPSPLETNFLSAAHDAADVDATTHAVAASLAEVYAES